MNFEGSVLGRMMLCTLKNCYAFFTVRLPFARFPVAVSHTSPIYIFINRKLLGEYLTAREQAFVSSSTVAQSLMQYQYVMYCEL